MHEHALELARASVTADLHDLVNGSHDDDPQYKARRKENILVKLKKLLPGAQSGLAAMLTTDGTVTTDPKDIADTLRDHWGHVFNRRPIDTDLLGGWLQRTCPRAIGTISATVILPNTYTKRSIWKKDVAMSIQNSGNSMPGPDRIPYKAWRCLGKLGIDVMFDAAQAFNKMMSRNSCEQLLVMRPALRLTALISASCVAFRRRRAALTRKSVTSILLLPRGRFRLSTQTTGYLRTQRVFDGSPFLTIGCRRRREASSRAAVC